jgi:hypothetical protein
MRIQSLALRSGYAKDVKLPRLWAEGTKGEGVSPFRLHSSSDRRLVGRFAGCSKWGPASDTAAKDLNAMQSL